MLSVLSFYSILIFGNFFRTIIQNFIPHIFKTLIIVEIRDSGEGNNVLVVDAVCDTFICNDAVITSELTVKFNDDKSFKYMGNKILNNGTKSLLIS